MTGMEFLEPRTGFFCPVCAKFSCGDEEAKKSHCSSLKHYENLEVLPATGTIVSLPAMTNYTYTQMKWNAPPPEL